MKFTAALSYLLVVLPLLTAAVPQRGGKGGRAGNVGGFGGFGGGNANNNNNNNNAAASATASAAGNSATSAAAAGGETGDPQTSLTLDPRVLAKGFEEDGQQVPTAGQVASATSVNNFINFCLTVPNLPITNGAQVTTGSCNPAPMGVIAAQTNMPSAKFTFPANGQTIPANQDFTISMALLHLEAGNFVNAADNYFAGPQTVNGAGDIVGHTHFVVETLDSLDQTTPLNSVKFAFFKGVNTAAVNGVVSEPVAGGLPAAAYRLCSINSAANHQPVLVAVAQHGSLDDCVYFTASEGGAAAASNATATTAAAAAAATTAAAGNKGGNAGNNAGNAKAGGNNNNNAKGGKGKGRFRRARIERDD